jgi:Zn-dependent protease
VLYDLAHPLTLLGVVLALVIGVTAHNLAQVGVARALGDATPRLRGFATVNLRRNINIYGLIAMLIVRYGWGFAEAVPMRDRYWTRRTRISLALAAGPIAYLALCVLAVAALRGALSAGLVNGVQIAAGAAETLAGLFIVSLLPVPPLDLGRIILTLAPPTRGWQQARHHLEERNLGLVIALAVLLLPTLLPVLPSVVGELAAPLLSHLASAFGMAFFIAPN